MSTESSRSGSSGRRNHSSTRPVCVFFKQSGGCWKKDKCHFRHIEPRTNINNDNNNNNNDNNSNQNQNQGSNSNSNSNSTDPVHTPNNLTPCKFFASGFCHRGTTCWFTHIDPSSLPSSTANPSVVDSTESTNDDSDSNPGNLFTSNSKGKGKSTSNLDSRSAGGSNSTRISQAPSKTECGICLEIPENYGLLESCQHAFCLSCIREWRRIPDINSRNSSESLAGKKHCPTCRTLSNLCIPSSLFHPSGSIKSTIIENYKASCSSKICKNYIKSKDCSISKELSKIPHYDLFSSEQKTQIRIDLSKEIKGKCIFGDDCLYNHQGHKMHKGFVELQAEIVQRGLRDRIINGFGGGRRGGRGGRAREEGERLLTHLMNRVQGMDQVELEMMMQMAGLDDDDDDEQDYDLGYDHEAEGEGSHFLDDQSEDDEWELPL